MIGSVRHRQQVWSRYWAYGIQHSCATSYGDQYGGAIAAFWREVFDDTPPGSRLLDVATGNGAIPRLWRTWRSGDTWDAVDLAAVGSLKSDEADDGIRYRSGVRAESLPFVDGAFDLVTSQYGLEYCDHNLAVQEVLRVLAPGGRVALLMHHADSRPVQLARMEMSHLEWALGPDGIMAACADMFEPVALAKTSQGRAQLARSPAAEALRIRFNAAQSEIRTRASVRDGSDILLELQDVVTRLLQTTVRDGPEAARTELSAWHAAWSDHRWRQRDLCAHALDEAGAQALSDRFCAAGLSVALRTLDEGPHRMGWTLVGKAA